MFVHLAPLGLIIKFFRAPKIEDATHSVSTEHAPESGTLLDQNREMDANTRAIGFSSNVFGSTKCLLLTVRVGGKPAVGIPRRIVPSLGERTLSDLMPLRLQPATVTAKVTEGARDASTHRKEEGSVGKETYKLNV